MKQYRPFAAWLATLALALFSMARPCLAGDDYERWYALEMGKTRAGWMVQSQKTEGDLVTTFSKTEMGLARGKTDLRIVMEGTFVETKAGKPVSMVTKLKASMQETTVKATFGEKDIEVKLIQAGRTETTTRPLPDGTWLPPAAAGDYIRQRMAAGADKVMVRTIEPVGGLTDPLSSLKPVTIERFGFSQVEFDFLGKTIKATKCTTTSSSQPTLKSIEVLDDQGIPLSTEQSIGPMSILARAVSKSDAMASHANPELLISTFVSPDKPIANARQTNRAVFLISVPDGKLPEIPTTGSQRVDPVDATTCRITIDSISLLPDDPGDAGAAMYTTCSATLNCNDPQVKKLAERATAKAGPIKLDRAQAIREFVYEFIDKKNLDVGFANATEVARNHHGDCTEHGVLTAALLRADGIPSRVVAGLIYADQFAGSENVFAYHMWAQALLDVNGKPTWVDMDATLPNGRTFDATHIALGVSALAGGDAEDPLVALVTMIGRLKIKVESAE